MNRPIALFDSGVGGLTVLRSVMELLPCENYLYFADNDYFPYGTKSYADLRLRLAKLLKFMENFNPKVVIIACNTASLHLEYLQNLTNIPIVDVISPTCKHVESVTKNKKVCLLATDATVYSQKYQQTLQKVCVDVVAIPCSDFVPIAEGGVCEQKAMEVISRKLQPIYHIDFDTVILGCTHFGLIKRRICNILGSRNYVQCGNPTAKVLFDVLRNGNLLSNATKGGLNIFTTGKTQSAIKVCRQLLLRFDSISTVQI